MIVCIFLLGLVTPLLSNVLMSLSLNINVLMIHRDIEREQVVEYNIWAQSHHAYKLSSKTYLTFSVIAPELVLSVITLCDGHF